MAGTNDFCRGCLREIRRVSQTHAPICTDCWKELRDLDVDRRILSITSLFGHWKMNETLVIIKATLESILEAAADNRDW